MIESQSPVLQELWAEWTREGKQAMIVDLLVDRFGAEAVGFRARLKAIEDDARLKELNKLAFTCANLEEFQKHLSP